MILRNSERKGTSTSSLDTDDGCWIQAGSDVSKDCSVIFRQDSDEGENKSLIEQSRCWNITRPERLTFNNHMLVVAKKIQRVCERKWGTCQPRVFSPKEFLSLENENRRDNVIARKDLQKQKLALEVEEARESAKQKLAMLRLQLSGQNNAIYLARKAAQRKRYARSSTQEVADNSAKGEVHNGTFTRWEEEDQADVTAWKKAEESRKLAHHWVDLHEGIVCWDDQRKKTELQKSESHAKAIQQDKRSCRSGKFVDSSMLEEKMGRIGITDASFSRYIFL